MFAILDPVALFVGRAVLLVLALYIVPSLIVSLVAFFVWWPQNNYKIYLSRVGYSVGAGFTGLWLWVEFSFYFIVAKGMVHLMLKLGESIESIARDTNIPSQEVYDFAYRSVFQENPFSLIIHEDFFTE